MKKKTDYIEEEGVPEEEMASEEEQELYAALVHERRMLTWEKTMHATDAFAKAALKGIKREFWLRIAQLLAMVAIIVILLAK